MATSFVNALQAEFYEDNDALTENGANVYQSTKSLVLDFFSKGGALRTRPENEITHIFDLAFSENPELAVKAMFYFRDVRGGQGERRTFNILLNHVANNHPEIIMKNLRLVAEYGRWDDLLSLIDTPVEAAMFEIVSDQLMADVGAERPSLLAKWLKSENTSSPASRAIAYKTRKALGLNSKEYRKTLSALRKTINIVETKMSNGEWTEINYEQLPSKAGMLYRKAFRNHDSARYDEFLEAVENGDAKINTGTLYPYDIVTKVLYNGATEKTLDVMWNNLPNYMEGSETNGLVVVDVSASMAGLPMAVAISMGMYISERTTGLFKDKFITFSESPTLETLDGDDIFSRIRNLKSATWGFNTNLEAVFDVVLNAAVKSGASQADIPSHLYIVSDMEFDNAMGHGSNPTAKLFDTIRMKYKAVGYEMPMLVFWNVDSRNDQSPMTMDERGFQMVSGCSPSILTSLLANKSVSAYDLMVEVLNADRYAPISV